MTLTASLPAFTDTLPSWQVVEVSQEDAGVQESRRAAAAAGRAARSTCRENLHPRQAHVTDAPAAPVATGTPLQDASNLPDLSHPQTAEVARKQRTLKEMQQTLEQAKDCLTRAQQSRKG
ncbi:hypothetical protein WJX82_010119 [Trebouxia sp. C0006]